MDDRMDKRIMDFDLGSDKSIKPVTVAILGHTGFVGSHLREAYPRAALYNSTNLDRLATDVETDPFSSLDLVFCTCVPAVKWMAQAHPEQDWDALQRIQEAIACLRGRCRRFVLISTIDVHNHALEGQREDTVVQETTSQEPYGRHRYAMERWCLEHITGVGPVGPAAREGKETTVTIVRLPALFGIGLKKNIVFDMLHRQRLDTIQPDSVFQWYDLAWLVEDIRWILERDISVAHLYPDPLRTEDLVARVFPEHLEAVRSHAQSAGSGAAAAARYNHRTLYPERFARSTEQVLEAMARFVSVWRLIHGPMWGKRMACTNLAWDSPTDDAHALFVLKRYGICNVELALTRYGQGRGTGPWDVFKGPTLLDAIRERYASAEMRIVSLQSLLYGVVPQGGTLASHKNTIVNHLKNVIRYATVLGATALVLGSPSLRVPPATEDDLCEILECVCEGAREAGVRLCVEPNAHGYGCTIGSCMPDVQSILEKSGLLDGGRDRDRGSGGGKGGIGINFDTGNAWMECDTEPPIRAARRWIGHMQISAPYLKTGEEAPDLERIVRTYRGILTEDSDGTGHPNVFVSIEAQCKSEMLAGHIRRVAQALC